MTTVQVVVVTEEHVAERTGVLDATEALGKRRVVFQVLKLRLTERVVVAHAGSRKTLRYAKIHLQLTDRLRAHGPSAIGMNHRLVGFHILGENRVFQHPECWQGS